MSIENQNYSFSALVFLLLTAFILIIIRKTFNIKAYKGPADSIYAAHRTDNELDIKQGFGSTFAALVSATGGASVGQYGPLVHFGATLGSMLRQITGNRLPWGRWPLTIHSGVWGLLFNVFICFSISGFSNITKIDMYRSHRQKFHDFLHDHMGLHPSRTKLRSFAYVIALIWLFFGVAGWLWVSVIWNDRALIVVNAVAVAIFLNGIFVYFLKG